MNEDGLLPKEFPKGNRVKCDSRKPWDEHSRMVCCLEVKCSVYDDHGQHIKEHKEFLDSIPYSNKTLIMKVLKHIDDHVELWREINL